MTARLVVSAAASAEVSPATAAEDRAVMLAVTMAGISRVPRAVTCAEVSAASWAVVRALTSVVVRAAIVLVGRPAIWAGVRLVKDAIGIKSYRLAYYSQGAFAALFRRFVITR